MSTSLTSIKTGLSPLPYASTSNTPARQDVLLSSASLAAPTLAQWLSGLKTVVARGGGSAAALKYIGAGPSAAPLRAAIATPAGRVAVVCFTLGIAAGTEAGKNIKFRAAMGALQMIASNENLLPAEKTRLAIETLRNAVAGSSAPAAPKDPYKDRSWERSTPLPKRLGIAKQTLAESEKLLAARPGDSDLQNIVRGQRRKVDDLQRKFNESQVSSPTSTPNRTPARTTPPAVKKSSTQPNAQQPAAISSPTQAKPSTRIGDQQDNQARQQSLATTYKKFNEELKKQLVVSDVANRQRVGQLIANSPRDVNKGYVDMINRELKTEGFGNIYKNDTSAPPSVRKNRDFNQYNTELGLLTGRDLKVIRAGLQKNLQSAVSANQASKPTVQQPTTATRPGVRVNLVNKLSGGAPRIDVWVNPQTGAVRLQDPRDKASVRVAVQIMQIGGGPLVPNRGKEPVRSNGDPEPDIWEVQILSGDPNDKKPPDFSKIAKILGASGFLVSAYLIQSDQDNKSVSSVDTESPKKLNAELIAKVTNNTSPQEASETRNKIWINYLDAAMKSLGSARQGGAMGWAGRFSKEEIAQIQKQVDDFKAKLVSEPQLSPADAQRPETNFSPNANIGDVKKKETIEAAFKAVNEAAVVDTKSLARKVFQKAGGGTTPNAPDQNAQRGANSSPQQVPAADPIKAALAQQIKDDKEAKEVSYPFRVRFDAAQKEFENIAPSNALPTSVALPTGPQPISPVTAQAIVKRMNAVDLKLQTIEKSLATVLNGLQSKAQASKGSVQMELAQLLPIVKNRWETVRSLRGELRTRAETLAARTQATPAAKPTQTQTPTPTPTPTPMSTLKPQPLPTVPTVPVKTLPRNDLLPQQPTPSPQATPTPLYTPMPTELPEVPAEQIPEKPELNTQPN